MPQASWNSRRCAPAGITGVGTPARSEPGAVFAQPMLSVYERGFAPGDRSEAGHWEGDPIVGRHQRSAIGTLVERQTRYVKLLHTDVQLDR